MQTHLLIDGDIVAFTASAVAQQKYLDPHGWLQEIVNTRVAEANADNMIATLMAGLRGDTKQIILSDPEDNWRRAVDPTYKTNRVGARPLALDHVKDYLREKYGAVHWPGLEADDTISILATRPGVQEGETRLIIVGRDKDFKSIPGLHHAWKQDVSGDGRQLLVREVSEAEADTFHLAQTLAGDRIDGFDGCPGIGMTRAFSILADPVRLVPKQGVKTRGVNKGDAVTRWMSEPTKDLWACIVSHYRKAGLTEEDALRTARLARLLRHGEYNIENEEVTLWVPEMIKTR